MGLNYGPWSVPAPLARVAIWVRDSGLWPGYDLPGAFRQIDDGDVVEVRPICMTAMNQSNLVVLVHGFAAETFRRRSR